MSDDEADPELLELLRKSLGLSLEGGVTAPETGVLESAEYIYNNSIDVALSMSGTKSAAVRVWNSMRERGYGAGAWSEHELHPKTKDEAALNFIFTMDLLNFSFFSGRLTQGEKFCIDYKGRRWTGYQSLCAALCRALDEGIPITSPSYWHPEAGFSDDVLKGVFRSATSEEMPLLGARIALLREASSVLFQRFNMSVLNLIQEANQSAAGLVNLLVDYFPSFRDEFRFEGRNVRILKRAQIFVADLWAAFEGQRFGQFDDIDKITMFADYRIPQILHTLQVLLYSPPLEAHIRARSPVPSGSTWEIEIRGCTIWAVELLRREILKLDPEAKVNAILIDFFLYDTMQEIEAKRKTGGDTNGEGEMMHDMHDSGEVEVKVEEIEIIPHHRTRSIWY